MDDWTLGSFEHLWGPGTSRDPYSSPAPRQLGDSWTPELLNNRTLAKLDHARLVPLGAWDPWPMRPVHLDNT